MGEAQMPEGMQLGQVTPLERSNGTVLPAALALESSGTRGLDAILTEK